MLSLLTLLLERTGIIVSVAFVLTRTPIFRRLINREQINFKEGLYLVVIFGLFGILGTYTGIPVQAKSFVPNYGFGPVGQEQALANSRVVGAFIAGLLGGPVVGLGAGLVAGVHRYFLGGFTAFSCGLSTVVEGLLAGFVGQKFGRVHVPGPVAFAAGALAEALQMVIILLLARPFPRAVELVQLIALPMIVANAAGITIFVLILQSVLAEEQRAGALQAQKALQIANQTLSYLRRGLNYDSAQAAARIIKNATQVAAVAITDQERILAHIGVGEDHHRPGSEIFTAATRRYMETITFSELNKKCGLTCAWSALISALASRRACSSSRASSNWVENRWASPWASSISTALIWCLHQYSLSAPRVCSWRLSGTIMAAVSRHWGLTQAISSRVWAV